MTARVTALLLIIISAFCVVLSSNLLVRDAARRLQRDLDSGQGLYGNDTKVVVLNSTSFEDNVYGKESAWLVEFYNTWCGHCQRFAPTWAALAADIYGWEEVVRIAAVDCAPAANTAFCRDHEVKHYPTLRFFPARSQPGLAGQEVTKRKTVDNIRHTVAELLLAEQAAGRGGGWPDMAPYGGNDLESVWENVPESVRFTVLLFEDEDSYIGTEVILDLSVARSDVQVRRVLNDSTALTEAVGIITYPSIVVVERNLRTIPLDIEENSREGFFEAVKSFLLSRGISVSKEDAKNVEEEQAQQGEVNVNKSEYKDNVVFQVDLENAVRYSLKREIPQHKFITGQALVALKKYLKVLTKYFPIGNKGSLFFEKLGDKVSETYGMRGQLFLEYVETLETEINPVFVSVEDWMGCKGSERRYRGYPCGLWTLFHTLTTNAVLQSTSDAEFNSLEVLDAMLGYVTHFFGCRECSKHFQEMARESLYGNVTGPDESILWLWAAHNQANKRLSGDVTEDPHHPKIQFPSKETCPTCRDSDGEWVDSQVLTYLKHMYIKTNINFTGWNTTPNIEVNKISLQGIAPTWTLASEEPFEDIQSEESSGNSLSLPFILYASSSILLVLILISI